MPRYRFEFLDEPGVEPVFLELENVEAAKAEAQKAMAETMVERLTDDRDTKLATRIYDEAGYLVARVDFQNVTEVHEVTQKSGKTG
ncbi:hypothetical protein SAMN04488498_14122 [Mesorhizobium albiziae]|uniref:DUF6894 domain-containing protein n=1 Tax=Neomesorhizobium albiziae TaxID=335020 RepID=A0A1I4FBC8_9HYPH|nr:hypothetical protein [Mesorhizobium albiziae]GLS30761.1 hypothetical protein GCM10007937_24690 [Mesorhizobium albiziae]SFL15275.1 hypothetical protein SAMN04488498_14122 [Mesorhizobium albiziae]